MSTLATLPLSTPLADRSTPAPVNLVFDMAAMVLRSTFRCAPNQSYFWCLWKSEIWNARNSAASDLSPIQRGRKGRDQSDRAIGRNGAQILIPQIDASDKRRELFCGRRSLRPPTFPAATAVK
jgi:hypothetical protein